MNVIVVPEFPLSTVTDNSSVVTLVLSDDRVDIVTLDENAIVSSTEQLVSLVSKLEQGPMGPPGPSGNVTTPYNFSYGDAFPAYLTTIAAGRRVVRVTVFLDVGINGVGATLSVGTPADHFQIVPLLLPTDAAAYEYSPQKVYSSNTDIYLFLTPGSDVTQGSGSIIIESQ